MLIDELLLFYQIDSKKGTLNEKEIYNEKKKNEEIILNLNKNNNKLTSNQILLEIKKLEELEKKKDKLNLRKNLKKIDLNQFIQREKNFEQKKQYNLEKNRFKRREEEFKENKKEMKPSRNKKIRNKTQSYSPLYFKPTERSKDIKETKMLKKQKEMNKTEPLVNITYNNQIKTLNKNNLTEIQKENLENKKLKRNKSECSSQKRISTWLNEQEKWVKKKQRNLIKSRSYFEKERKTLENLFHPQISQGSINILNSMGKYNNTTNTFSRNKFFEKLNNSIEIQKKKKQQIYLKTLPSFQPVISNNYKYKNIIPRYFNFVNDNGNIKVLNKEKKINKNKRKYISKSEKKRSNYQSNFITIKNGKKKNSSVEHWSKILLNMKKMKPNEILYHLNIMPSSAWNENTINIVPLYGNTKNIIKNFI